jgi:hypothetical protein
MGFSSWMQCKFEVSNCGDAIARTFGNRAELHDDDLDVWLLNEGRIVQGGTPQGARCSIGCDPVPEFLPKVKVETTLPGVAGIDDCKSRLWSTVVIRAHSRLYISIA